MCQGRDLSSSEFCRIYIVELQLMLTQMDWVGNRMVFAQIAYEIIHLFACMIWFEFSLQYWYVQYNGGDWWAVM